ncbi:SDR family oxidoreductase [Yinghuangia aomiensis]|uniref:SDR family oxidoreductase n=1 Tax=Yinghuangia aomiensis TaxID=676205 RepID=A0ABP9I1L7_9ACTN
MPGTPDRSDTSDAFDASVAVPRPDDALLGSRVVVTGGGTGIGRAAAHAFAAAGARVLVVGRTAATLAETAREHPRVHCLAADVGAPEAPAAIVETALDLLGGIDILVNNAAQVRIAPLGAIDVREAQAQVATNLLAPLFLTQAALPHLADAKGAVVNVSTAGAGRGWPGQSVYGAAKAGLDFLTRTWALELAPRGIRVVAVSPGPVDTPIIESAGLTPEQITQLRERQRQRVPLGRIGRPEEVAWWIVNVCRPEASFTTGLNIPVDGGASVIF